MLISRPRMIGVVASMAAVIAGWASMAASARALSTAAAGTVKFVAYTGSSFDRFTSNSTPAFRAWMNGKFWRAEVFSPYFDDKTSWYPHGWAYRDLYALYRDSAYTAAHPNWILRDAAGNRLYIPWGCSGGSCPQFAADIGNQQFRRAWIAEAKAELAKGYAGLLIDDVNLDFRVGDGAEQFVDPIDPNTGQPMTERAWRGYMATFVEEIRQALPGVELVHNSIWYAGGPERDNNQFVRREIASADYINLERGVNDAGLTGGRGEWSLQALLSFIDRVHAAGRRVLLDGGDSTPGGREYSLASYFLVATGEDGVGLGSMAPEDWWPAYDIDLGPALGARASWEGLLRRDFADGLALVNEPQAPARTVTLPAAMLTTGGAVVARVTLGAGQGAVLRYVSPPGRQRAARVIAHKRRHRSPRARRASGPRFRGHGVTLHVHTRARRGGLELFVSGRSSWARSGLVAVWVQGRRHGIWITARSLRCPLHAGGRFDAAVSHLRRGRYRVRAAYSSRSREPS